MREEEIVGKRVNARNRRKKGRWGRGRRRG